MARTPAESLALVEDTEVALAAWLPSAVFGAAEELRWVQALNAGVDFYDHEALGGAGVLVNVARGPSSRRMRSSRRFNSE